MEHISKELAEWIRSKGCRLRTDKAYYGNARIWHDAVVETEGYYRTGNLDFIEAKLLFRYSWYDILVTHAVSFWGEEELCHFCGWGECDHIQAKRITAHSFRSKDLLDFLQEGKTQEAEEYVKTHSLFAKK